MANIMMMLWPNTVLITAAVGRLAARSCDRYVQVDGHYLAAPHPVLVHGSLLQGLPSCIMTGRMGAGRFNEVGKENHGNARFAVGLSFLPGYEPRHARVHHRIEPDTSRNSLADLFHGLLWKGRDREALLDVAGIG